MSDDPIERRLAALPEPDLTDPDNPEWTKERVARARRDEHLLPPQLQALIRRPRGRPLGSVSAKPAKTPIKLRLDPDIIAAFKASGPGWQTRINDALRAAVIKG